MILIVPEMYEAFMKTVATASIATPESDREIRERENAKGRWAKLEGKGREECPWTGGLCELWWLEGYDSISAATIEK